MDAFRSKPTPNTLDVAGARSRFAALSNEQLYQLELAFGRITVVTAKARPKSRWAPPDAPDPEPEYQVVFAKPSPAQYQMFRAQAQRDDQRARSQENLARGTVIAVVYGASQTVHDGQRGSAAEKNVREAFDRLLTDYPAIPEAAAGDIGELAGLAKDESEKG